MHGNTFLRSSIVGDLPVRFQVFRFDKTADGNTVSYTREVNEYRVFADIRARGRTTFYAYKLPRDLKKQDMLALQRLLKPQRSQQQR